jgi:hypothetical protein
MDINTRKKKIEYMERGLDGAMRKLALATTLVRKWRARLRIQQAALQREMEERVNVPLESAHIRRFRT